MSNSFHKLASPAALAVIAALSVGLLAGCQTPATHAVNKVINFGNTELSPELQKRNMAGMVAFDEVWAGDYNFTNRNLLYPLGIISGTPEYGLRVARVVLRMPEYGAWVRTGEYPWHTAAIVPDHLPPLKAGDIAEIRQTGMYNVTKDFVATGEGNIVLRVLCRAAQPDYKECLKAQPRVGRFEGYGPTNTDYPASTKEYGFTFTPKYDAKGQALR